MSNIFACAIAVLCLFNTFTRPACAEDFSGAQQILKARSPQEALGLPPGATADMIKQAHRRLAKEYFPKANMGDRLATEVMQKLNGAKDQLTKQPIDSNSRAYYGSEAGGARGSAQSQWSEFGARMDAAQTAEERAKIRADQVKRASSAMDFSTIAGAGSGNPQEAVEFARTHMDVFLQKSPGIRELNALASTARTAEGQQAIYRAALAQAYSPEQMLKLLKPDLSSMGGGMNWIGNLEAAIRAELPRFFEFGPTVEQIERLRTTLRVAYRQKGEAMFNEAAKLAIAKKTRGASASLLEKPGLMNRLMGKLAKRFFAVDPSLATGVASELVGGAEAEALDGGTCPSSFVNSSGRVLTAEYRQLLAMKGRDATDLVAYDCAQSDAELGRKLSALADADRNAATAALKAPGQRVRCRAGGTEGPSIELTLASGHNAEVRFATPDRISALEIKPQAGAANRNYFLKAEFGRDVELSYCAYAPKTATPREQLRIIRESEKSFLTRATCAAGGCDHLGFIENTDASDSNVFMTSGSLPDETRPFGELDKGYLKDVTNAYRSIISPIRGVSAERRNFAEVCRALGGDPPEVSHHWANTPRLPEPKFEPASSTSK